MKNKKWYNINVGLDKTEWYPVLIPISRRIAWKRYSEDNDSIGEKYYRRYYRNLFQVNLFLWGCWWLLFPIVKWLYSSINELYVAQELYNETNKKFYIEEE